MKPERITVLYLDDEEQNLVSFKASFRREFKIFTTTSPQEAVAVLNAEEVHVVISDQKMPEISGVEFFELILPDFPDPARMLMTGFSDIEAVVDSINRGQVFRYLNKPWDPEDVRMSIRNGYEMYRVRVDLRNRNAELEQTNRELERFIYSASHDLRAPLASIKGVLQLAEAEPEGVNEYLGMIDRSVNRLDSFVRHVIDYFQNHKRFLETTAFELHEVLDEVLEALGGLPQATELSQIGLDKTIHGDRMRWRMIFTNLMSNAFKFKDPTKETAQISFEAQTESGNVALTYKDNGLGMDEKTRSQAFEMFFRTSSPSDGTGLGLYIVSQAVEAMGGSIDLESEPGEGTTMSISIPQVVTEPR